MERIFAEVTNMPVQLVVYGVKETCPISILREAFSQFGLIEEVNVSNIGHATLIMNSISEATLAFEALNGSIIDGCKVHIEIKSVQPKRRRPDSDDNSMNSIDGAGTPILEGGPSRANGKTAKIIRPWLGETFALPVHDVAIDQNDTTGRDGADQVVAFGSSDITRERETASRSEAASGPVTASQVLRHLGEERPFDRKKVAEAAREMLETVRSRLTGSHSFNMSVSGLANYSTDVLIQAFYKLIADKDHRFLGAKLLALANTLASADDSFCRQVSNHLLDLYKIALAIPKPLALDDFLDARIQIIPRLESVVGSAISKVIEETYPNLAKYIEKGRVSSSETAKHSEAKGSESNSSYYAARLESMLAAKDERIADLEKRLRCSICMVQQVDAVLNCCHTFCILCTRKLETCPMCRISITSRQKMYL